MRYFRNIFLVLSIAPILLTFYLAALNLDKNSKLRLLVWETETQNFGLLLALGSSLGFSLSSLNVLLASRDSIPNRRRVVKTIDDSSNSIEETPDYSEFNHNEVENDSQEYYLERDIRDPSPTIPVPYKIISKPNETFGIHPTPSSDQKNKNVTCKSNFDMGSSKINQEESLIENDWLSNANEDW